MKSFRSMYAQNMFYYKRCQGSAHCRIGGLIQCLAILTVPILKVKIRDFWSNENLATHIFEFSILDK